MTYVLESNSIIELFKSEGGPLRRPTCSPLSVVSLPMHSTRDEVMRAQLSNHLFSSARRRHCEARQTLRALLDRYVKP